MREHPTRSQILFWKLSVWRWLGRSSSRRRFGCTFSPPPSSPAAPQPPALLARRSPPAPWQSAPVPPAGCSASSQSFPKSYGLADIVRHVKHRQPSSLELHTIPSRGEQCRPAPSSVGIQRGAQKLACPAGSTLPTRARIRCWSARGRPAPAPGPGPWPRSWPASCGPAPRCPA